MARKDFAESGGRQASRKPPMAATGQLRNMLLVVGILLVVAGSFVSGFWLGKGRDAGVSEGISKEAKDQLLAEIRDQQRELTALKEQLKKKTAEKKPAATDQVGDLTFYNSLPKQAVTPAPMSRSPKAPHQQFDKEKEADGAAVGDVIQHELDASPDTASAQGTFRVQVGSYQKRADAEALVSQLRVAGIPGRVEETQVAELGVWYRVYLGPYASRDGADAAIKVVQQRMHITGLLLRGK